MDEMMRKEKLFADFGDLLLQRHVSDHQQDEVVAETDYAFGRFIRAAREKVDLTREELAMIIDIPVATIAAIESGVLVGDAIEAEWVYDLAAALGEQTLTLNLLLGRESDDAIVENRLIVKWIQAEDIAIANSKPFHIRWITSIYSWIKQALNAVKGANMQGNSLPVFISMVILLIAGPAILYTTYKEVLEYQLMNNLELIKAEEEALLLEIAAREQELSQQKKPLQQLQGELQSQIETLEGGTVPQEEWNNPPTPEIIAVAVALLVGISSTIILLGIARLQRKE